MSDQETCLRWLGHILTIALLVAAFFLAFPTVDLEISGLFGSRLEGFLAVRQSGLQDVRLLMFVLTDGLMICAALALVLNLIAPALAIVDTRVLAFCLTSYAVGPGLITNGLLKRLSERARPRDIIDFGGDALYSAPFHLSGQCSGNCSFVSGETSALAAVATMVLLLVMPRLSGRTRLWAIIAVIVILCTGSVLRIAFGAHFPSDVIFAVLVTSPVVITTYLVFGLHRLDHPFAPRLLHTHPFEGDHMGGVDA